MVFSKGNIMLRWETPTRYYAATLYRDLLGDTIVATCHGGRRNNLGSMHVRLVRDEEEGRAALDAIGRRRAQRKYKLVISTNPTIKQG